MALALMTAGPTPGTSAPVSPEIAARTAAGWLHAVSGKSETLSGHSVAAIRPHAAADGGILFFEVSLHPAGFLLMPADDELEPVTAFAGQGRFMADQRHPLYTLVTSDLAGRRQALRRGHIDAATRRTAAARWQSCAEISKSAWRPEISDVRVPPLIATAWDQGSVGGALCYNYWTPGNYPSGGLATALAQLMRCHRHPVIGVGARMFQIKVDGQSRTRALLGGDGAGGAYLWDLMPDTPDRDTPDAQRRQIGALCHDIGVAAGTHYSANNAATQFTAAMQALQQTFMYSHYIIGFNGGNNIGASLNRMLNPGLDAGLPAILGIFNNEGGHAVVCDGYGYTHGTLYHHLNLGWGATLAADNVWYALPMINTSLALYDSIKICAYNIMPYGSGEIISGRVTDANGDALESVLMTVSISNGPTITAISDSRGIYAFSGLPSDSDAVITADRNGYHFEEQPVRTGRSVQQDHVCGNLWGIDFTGTPARRPVPADYTGNGRADYAWYDESRGLWKVWRTGEDPATFTFGGRGWTPVPADYDGDGRADPAVYHAGSGTWSVLLSDADYRGEELVFGGPEWQPVPADYDGDGRADPAIYNTRTGIWQARLSGNGYQTVEAVTPLGGRGWTPVPADYDGDGRADPAVCHPASGEWKVMLSGDAYRFQSAGFTTAPGAQPVPGDYDGDGRADPAFYLPDAGRWIMWLSAADYTETSLTFGGPAMAPAPADYTGDGRADCALYRIDDDTWTIHSIPADD